MSVKKVITLSETIIEILEPSKQLGGYAVLTIKYN